MEFMYIVLILLSCQVRITVGDQVFVVVFMCQLSNAEELLFVDSTQTL